MDCVFIQQLKVECIIGIYEAEKKSPQPLLIDAEIFYDSHGAGLADDYSRVIDYAKVCADITTLLQESRFELVETAGEQICALIFAKYHAASVRLKICKPWAVENAAGVGVILERNAR